MNERKISRIGYVIRLSHYIKGMGIYLFLSILFNLLFKMLPIVISLVISYMISMAVLNSMERIGQMFLAVVILVILAAILAYCDVLVSHDMAYRILTKLRNAAYDKIDELAPAAMENRHSGELTSIVLEDIELLEWFYAHTIGQIVVAVILPVASLILLGLISPVLPLVLFPFIAGMICVPVTTSRSANAQGVSVRKAFSDLNAQIVDGVQGLKDIISFGWQESYFTNFMKALSVHQDAQIKYAGRSGEESRRVQFMIGLGSLCGEGMAAVLVAGGHMDRMWLLPVFALCSAIFVPLQDALSMSTNYGLIFGAAKRLFELFQSKPAVEDSGTGNASDVIKPNVDKEEVTVAFNHVAFSYPTDNKETSSDFLIQDLSFSVSTGETVALVGASGCGKTTAVRLLQRFWDVDSGLITMNGVDIRKLKLESLRDIITVVPQEVYLFNMSVMENLRMARQNASEQDIKEAAERAQADEFIRKLPRGYHTVLGERGLRLSGGEKQRLSIAQAFLKDSPVLILDEASANLDSETERKINLAIDKLKRGRATLVIAHRISTIQKADRIVVIRDGRVAGTGTYDKLMKECPYFVHLTGGEEYAQE